MEENTDIKSTPAPEEPDAKPKKKHLIHPTWLRRTLKCLGVFILVVILLPFLIYVPPVQDWLVDFAETKVKESTGMDVSIEKFRLKFPLDVSLRNLTVVEASGDTMIHAGEAVADVKLLPLLKLDVKVKKLRLDDAYYRLVSADTSMIMTIKAGMLEVDDKSAVSIKTSEIDLNKATIADADISMYMDVWKKKQEPEDTAKAQFKIRIGDLDGTNIRFGMSSLPTIDTLAIYAGNLLLKDGLINLATSRITAASLTAADGDFTFLTPTPEYVKTHPAPIDTMPDNSEPMVIEAVNVQLSNFNGLYGVAGAKPKPGFDTDYLQLSGIDIRLHNFYNEASTLRLPITLLKAHERCGLQITEGHGFVGLDSTGITIDTLAIRTPYSRIDLTAGIPFSLMELKPYAPVNVFADMSIGLPDVTAFMPSLKTYTSMIKKSVPVSVLVNANGTLSNVDLSAFDVAVPSVVSLRASGYARNPLDFKNMVAHLNIDGNLLDPGIVSNFTGGADLGFAIPKLKIEGEAGVDHGTYSADLAVITDTGDITAKGHVNLDSEIYQAHLAISNFNAGYFLPDLGLGKINAVIDAKGDGFNPEKPGASTDISAAISELEYKGTTLRDIDLTASLSDHLYDVTLSSPNDIADIRLDLSGSVYPDDYSAVGTIDCRHLDLRALGLDTAANELDFDLDIDAKVQPSKWLYDVKLAVNRFDWIMPEKTYNLPDGIDLDFLATANDVNLDIRSQDTNLHFESPEGLEEMVQKFSAAAFLAMSQIEDRQLQVDTLQQTLPPFHLSFSTPDNGIVHQLLEGSDIAFGNISLNLNNDSTINGNVAVLDFAKGADLNLDTLTLDLSQRNYLLDYKLHVGNQPGTMDELADVNISGYVGGNRASVYLNQRNLAGETGYKIGFTAAIADNNMVTVHFTPLNAMIGYHPWTLNSDNYVDVNLNNYKVEANLEGQSNESAILLQTRAGADDNQELHIKLTNIKIQDFLQMSATAPPLTATVNSDIRARYDGQELVGIGRLGITDFSYDGTKIDDMNLTLQASMNADNTYDLSVGLAVDKKKALTLSSKLAAAPDGSGLQPEFVKLNLDKFPLTVANAFLGNDVAQLQGTLSGDMDLSGGFTKPVLNGSLTCDSVSVYLPIMGSSLKFDDTPLTVTDNLIRFNQFDIWGANKNPLTIDGTIDATKLNDIHLDVTANANNFQLVGNDRRAGSDLYGKLFLNLNASAKGPLTHFNANATLNILGSTDVYYTIPDANTAIEARQNQDVVKFVNLSDTVTVVNEEPQSVYMRVQAAVTIQPGTMVTVNLSTNGTDRVQLNPSGTVNLYRNFMGDITLNGQINTGNGMARYNVPVIGEKEFTINPNSYVHWNGAMMNPTLSLNATDAMKVSVSQNGGNSRLVNFLVKLAVSGTLSAPQVLFDLATEDDMTIENQLQSMTADQRNSAAMNLLITGQYSEGGISTNSGPLVGNVYSFLTQQLNSWAAKNIRGVDLSFGVNQYDMTNDGQTSTTTSYSYQLSKSLFNNRFKISIGGNYSTDDNTDDNLTQNLISDISFEYILRQTQAQTMLVKLFRHNGYESILEGEITEMGAGFVYKRKLGDFRSFFNTGRRRRKNAARATTDSVTVAPADSVTNVTDR